MLVCSFLGGMRAVTWTQVGQYIILVIAYLVPVIWLSVKHTHVPVPQLSAGAVLQQVTEKEVYPQNDPSEIGRCAARGSSTPMKWQRRAAALPESPALKGQLRSRLAQLNANDAPMVEIRSAERELALSATRRWKRRDRVVAGQGVFRGARALSTPHAEPFPRQGPWRTPQHADHFLALVLCLMLGNGGHAAHPMRLHHAVRHRGAALVLVAAVHPAAVFSWRSALWPCW